MMSQAQHSELLEHILTDVAGTAASAHIEELIFQILEDGPGSAHVAIAAVCWFTSELTRAVLAPAISPDTPFGLQMDVHPGVSSDAPDVVGSTRAAQVLTAYLNGQGETAAAITRAAVEQGADHAAYMLTGALKVFRATVESPEGREAYDAMTAPPRPSDGTPQ